MAETMLQKSLLFTPEGVRDIYGGECRKREKIQNGIHDTMKLYGFRDIKTPAFEFFDIFNRQRGTVNSKEMFKFFDQYNNTLALRPDITPSIARCVAKYYDTEEMQIRLCYVGDTYIHRSGYQGKLSEVTQVGAELMNDSSSDADGEMIAMTIECLQKSGLQDFQVDVGHAGLFRGLVREACLAEEDIEKLRNYITNKNIFAARELMEHLDMPSACRDLLVQLPDLFGDSDTIRRAREKTKDRQALDALDRLEKIHEIIRTYGMEEHVTFDLGMLSHYEYYTGVIFKAYTYGTGDAIVTGGRYDSLIEQFGKKTPAIGLAFVLDELMTALGNQHVAIDAEEEDILILYRSANRAKAVAIANELRAEGKPSRLMRKNAETALDVYKEYGRRSGVSVLLYIDDTGEVTEFEMK